MRQADLHTPPARPAPVSQQNPGSTRLALLDARRSAALSFLKQYYDAVGQGRVLVD